MENQAISKRQPNGSVTVPKLDGNLSNALAVLALELQAGNRLKPDAVKILVPLLERDLAEYPVEAVLKAIAEHRKQSPFWPALSDIIKLIAAGRKVRGAIRMERTPKEIEANRAALALIAEREQEAANG